MSNKDGWDKIGPNVWEKIDSGCKKYPYCEGVEFIHSRKRWYCRIIKKGDLISFSRIADWCARVPNDPLTEDDTRRDKALENLAQSVLLGEFGPPEKPRVALLFDEPAGHARGKLPLRLMRGNLIEFLAGPAGGYARFLWAPRDRCIEWFRGQQIPPPNWLTVFRNRDDVQRPAAIPTKAIPATMLRQHLEAIMAQGGPVPAADKLVKQIQDHFPNYRVTRADVRSVHSDVFGGHRPGPRSNSAA